MKEKKRKYMSCLIKSIFHIFTENSHFELSIPPFFMKKARGFEDGPNNVSYNKLG